MGYVSSLLTCSLPSLPQSLQSSSSNSLRRGREKPPWFLAHSSCLRNGGGTELQAGHKVIGREGAFCELSPEAGSPWVDTTQDECQELMGPHPNGCATVETWQPLQAPPCSHSHPLPFRLPPHNSFESALPVPLSSSRQPLFQPRRSSVTTEILACSPALFRPLAQTTWK